MTPDRLAAIHARCFQTPRPWTATEFEDLLTKALLLTSAHGFLVGRVIAGEAELLTVAVDPTARRGGEGRTLVQRFLERAASLDADTSFLEVASDNIPALSLYKTLGFSQAGVRAKYYRAPDGTRVDALIMQRAVP